MSDSWMILVCVAVALAGQHLWILSLERKLERCRSIVDDHTIKIYGMEVDRRWPGGFTEKPREPNAGCYLDMDHDPCSPR